MTNFRKRFFISIGANAGRAAVSFAVGILIARGLGPAEYGNLAYLLGSFWAIRALLDVGSSSAFYTFIAQRERGSLYYVVYFSWLVFQFIFSVALVVFLLPEPVVTKFWLGIERELILLAFFATFLQNQVWQTVSQMHESKRMTARIQMAGLLIIISHLLLIGAMFIGNLLNLSAVLWAIIAEYFVAAVWLCIKFRNPLANDKSNFSVEKEVSSKPSSVVKAYIKYCRPMVVIAVFSFCYEIADRWLLQRYGGSSQQGFYQVAAQLSTVSLLAATSILSIFWKEIAEANEHGDHSRVARLYQKTSQSLVFVAAFVTCFLVPWSQMLVDVLLGSEFHSAWPVLMLMLFYPVHQAVGQINGTLFMATAQNSTYMKITVSGLLVSIPLAYLLIAEDDIGIGYGLGAMGLAIKIVGLNFLFVNFQSWVISKKYNIYFQWREQIGSVVMLVLLGFISKYLGTLIMTAIDIEHMIHLNISMWLGVFLSGLFYLALSLVLILKLPRLAGLHPEELRMYWHNIIGILLVKRIGIMGDNWRR